MGRLSDLRLSGREFDCRPLTGRQVVDAHVTLSYQAVYFAASRAAGFPVAGKVTAGLGSQTYGLKAVINEGDAHPAYDPRGVWWRIYLYCCACGKQSVHVAAAVVQVFKTLKKHSQCIRRLDNTQLTDRAAVLYFISCVLYVLVV